MQRTTQRALPWILVLASPAYSQGTILNEIAELRPSDPTLGWFGYDVALDGATVLVTHRTSGLAANRAGSVWSFERDSAGISFIEEFGLEATEFMAAGDSMDLTDELLVVGATGWPSLQQPYLGRAFVFDRIGDGFAASGVLDPPTNDFVTAFAADIEILSPDLIAVARYGHLTDVNQRGSVCLYGRDQTGWIFLDEITPADSHGLDTSTFGRCLAFDGTTLVAGQDGFDSFVYELQPNDTLRLVQVIDVGAGAPSSFGKAIAIEGDLLAIGDARDFGDGPQGRVHVFRRVEGVFREETILTASDGFVVGIGGNTVNDKFGYSLDIDEGRILVGALKSSRGVLPPQITDMLGGAYLFEYKNGAWTETYRLFHSDPGPYAWNGFHGNAVDLDGDAAIVGAQTQYLDLQPGTGAAFLYEIPFGDAVCEGAMNSTGSRAQLDVTGDRRADIGRLELEASDLPLGATTLFIASTESGFVANPAGSQGNLCLSGTISRFLSLSGSSDTAGVFSATLDMQSIPTPASGPVAIQPGDTYVFQAWYRDANPGPTSNFTGARSVLFR